MLDSVTDAPAIKDGIGAVVLEGKPVYFDATDWALIDGEIGVVVHKDGRISVETIRDSLWGQPAWRMKRIPRLGMIDNPKPKPDVISERVPVTILERPIER